MEQTYILPEYPNIVLTYHTSKVKSTAGTAGFENCWMTFSGGRDEFFNFIVPTSVSEWMGEELFAFIQNYVSHIDTTKIKLSDLFSYNNGIRNYLNAEIFDKEFITNDEISKRIRLFGILAYGDKKARMKLDIINNIIYYYDKNLGDIKPKTNIGIIHHGLNVRYFRITLNGQLILYILGNYHVDRIPLSLKYDYAQYYDALAKIYTMITDTNVRHDVLLNNYTMSNVKHIDNLMLQNYRTYEFNGKSYNDNQLVHAILRLPLFLDGFRTFVQNECTKSDLIKLMGNIGNSVRNNDVAIKLARDIIESNEDILFNKIETYYNFSACFKKTATKNEYLALHNYLIDNKNKILADYLYDLSKDFINNKYNYSPKDLNYIMDYFFKGKVSTWVCPKYAIGNVIELLSGKMTNVEIYSMITSFPSNKEDNRKMTYDNWIKYIDNYDEYKEYPPSWWMSLIE